MGVEASRFAKLTALAGAAGSEDRRVLLREVSDMFIESDEDRSEREQLLFDEVLSALAADMADEHLADLAGKVADAARPPRQLILDLAHRTAPVAVSVLQKARSLTEEDLLAVIEKRGQEHVRAIARRETVSERLSEAIVTKGDDDTLDVLLRNDGAKIARPTMERVVERARANEKLHEATVGRQDMPLDLLNDMYFVVEKKLREKILEKNSKVAPEDLDAALARARARIERDIQVMTEEAKLALALVQRKKAARELTPSQIVSWFRENRINEFVFGLAELTELDPETVRRIVQKRDLDALATACRAAGVERALFVTLAVLIVGGDQGLRRAEEFGRLYAGVPIEAAQRAMRFLKVRKGVGAAAA